jgi:ketosteroid isomerase-like protein
MDYWQRGLRDSHYGNRAACSRGRAGLVVVLAVTAAIATTGCRSEGDDRAAAERDIRAVLARQVQSWNDGDLAGFMEGYEKSDRLRFHSGGDVTLGWQTVSQRYRTRYQDRAAMGTLTFSEVAVELVAPDVAVAYGRWRLQRAQDQPSGLFTLVLRQRAEGWRVVYDHTSSAK